MAFQKAAFCLYLGHDKAPKHKAALGEIPNHPCFYRHKINGMYYGAKKHKGKRKEHSRDDRKLGERKLRTWIENLDKVDSGAEKASLAQLLEKFQAIRQGMSDHPGPNEGKGDASDCCARTFPGT